MSDDAELAAVDHDALERALNLVLAVPGDFAEHVRGMLQDRTWREVAEFASYSIQCDVLELRPWELPPASGGTPAADALGARLRACGLSVFEPSPISALAQAERPKRR